MLSRSNISDSLFTSGPSWASGASQVELLISRACNPSLSEPNYPLNLEVANYINEKKANTCVCHSVQLVGSILIRFITIGRGTLPRSPSDLSITEIPTSPFWLSPSSTPSFNRADTLFIYKSARKNSSMNSSVGFPNGHLPSQGPS